METKEPKLVSAIVVECGGRILLLQRGLLQSNPLHWCLPGGKIKTGESAFDAGMRELKEETGIDIRAHDLQKPDAPLWSGPSQGNKHLSVFLARLPTMPRITLEDKEIGCAWFSYSDITHLGTVIPSGALEAIRTMNKKSASSSAPRSTSGSDRSELLRYLRTRRGG